MPNDFGVMNELVGWIDKFRRGVCSQTWSHDDDDDEALVVMTSVTSSPQRLSAWLGGWKVGVNGCKRVLSVYLLSRMIVLRFVYGCLNKLDTSALFKMCSILLLFRVYP